MRWAFLLLVLALIHPNALWAAESLEFPADKSEVQIKLVRSGDLLLAPVKVNGHSALFLLDTGAAAIDLTETFVAAHPVANVGENIANGQHVPKVALSEFEVGGVKLRNTTASVLSLALFDGSRTQQGTIGGTFLEITPFTINWSQATLTLHRAAPKPPADAIEVPIWVFGSRPYIEAIPGSGTSGWFGLDTGAEAGFGLESSYVQSNRQWLAPLRKRIVTGTTFDGIANYFHCYLPDAQMAGLSLGKIEGFFPVTPLKHSAFPPPASGLIGQDILKHFEITFDYQKSVAWIRPARAMPAEWNDPKFDPQVADLSRLTPLMRAAAMGDIEHVRRFAAVGAAVAAKDKIGKTALHYAANAAVVEELIAAGATVDAKADGGFTPLQRLAWLGNVDAVTATLTHQPDVNAVDENGGTALMYAAGAGSAETVSLLIKAGAAVETADANGTALTNAASHGHAAAMKVLLDAGARIDNAEKAGSPLLVNAAAWGSSEVIELLLDRGVDINARSSAGHTALMIAAYWGHAKVVTTLLARGADPAGKTDNATALDIARQQGHLDIARQLYFPNPPPKRLEFPVDRSQISVRLRRAGDLLLVPVRINGADAGLFYLDTGTSGIVVDDSFAKSRSFPSAGDAVVAGNQQALIALDEVEIAGVKLNQSLAISADLSREGPIPSLRGPHGIIGGEFLRQIPFAISWSAPRLTLYREKIGTPADAIHAPLWLVNDRPAIYLAISEGVAGWFELRTGSENQIQLTTEFGTGHWPWFSAMHPHAQIPTLRSPGTGTQPIDLAAVLEKPRLAGIAVPPQMVSWARLAGAHAPAPPAAGSLGNGLLKRFELFFDYQSGSCWLGSDPNAGKPGEWSSARFDPRIVDSIRYSPLMRAARMDLLEEVKRFIAAGTDVNTKDYFGNTALHLAAERSSPLVLQTLVNAGALIDPKNASDTTPLMAAAASGNTAAVQWLLQHHADQKATDRYDRTALQLATGSTHGEIIAILVKARLGILP